MICYDIYLTAIGLTPSGSSTAHIYTQTIHTNTQKGTYITNTKLNMQNNKKLTKIGKCEPCPVFTSYTLTVVLQLRKKHGKTSARVAARTIQADTVQYKNNEQHNTQKKHSNTE
jgi:hypothetical protein